MTGSRTRSWLPADREVDHQHLVTNSTLNTARWLLMRNARLMP